MHQTKYSIILIILFGLLIHKYYCKEQIYTHRQPKSLRFHVAEFNFEHVSNIYSITLWILLGSLAKIGHYHKLIFNEISFLSLFFFCCCCLRFSSIASFNRKIT